MEEVLQQILQDLRKKEENHFQGVSKTKYTLHGDSIFGASVENNYRKKLLFIKKGWRWVDGNPIPHVLMGQERQKERATGEMQREEWATGFNARDDDRGNKLESSKDG